MATGHVFHPGHDEWHGQTVVVFTKGKLTVIGRWHDISGANLHMHDVALHDATRGAESREAWVARLQQYGVPSEHKDFALPHTEIDRVTRLRDA